VWVAACRTEVVGHHGEDGEGAHTVQPRRMLEDRRTRGAGHGRMLLPSTHIFDPRFVPKMPVPRTGEPAISPLRSDARTRMWDNGRRTGNAPASVRRRCSLEVDPPE
jgi:hypothetical protein